ncbi:GGDEF domain-containing protein [Desulfatibacillum aliphaticivorans]|uniref:diguanylate cyclase n=1 Tax=Desulfatibacillum aliphaticivorans TaxID=218208 RepID=B8FAT3_DESAL|nr:GGDEF domain-containing protein [Desulfatibacillum aliphaticivorans]ACL03379.1 diguanylate cyclase [Desulfatibacillum aliphaticivorans]
METKEQNEAVISREEFTSAMSGLVFKTLQLISKRGEPLTPEMLAELLMEDPNYKEALEKAIQDRVESDGVSLTEQEILLSEIQTLTDERNSLAEKLNKYKKEILVQGVEEADETSEAKVCPRRFRFLLISFLNIVRLDMGLGKLEELDALAQEAHRADSSEVLSRVADRILDLVESRLEIVHDERKQNAEFLKAVDDNLIAIEGQVLDTHAENQQSHEDNQAFFGEMDGKVKDVSQTLSSGTDSPEFRVNLLEKMQLIKSALEEKHARDVKRLNNANSRMTKLKKSLKSLMRQVGEAQSRARILEEQAMVDALTEIPNRRAYEERLAQEWSRYQRSGSAFSMLMVDLDRFKSINDTFGHAVGDTCLQGVVSLLKPNLRSSDFLARFGGEEFVIILPDTTREGAVMAGEKLRKKVEKANFVYDGEKVNVTISVGGTKVREADKDTNDLFIRLDEAMYQAKESGRNRMIWQD